MGLENEVTKVVNAYGDAMDNLEELLSSKKQTIAKQIVNVLLLLIILIVFGCLDFLHLNFHFEYLGDPNYWAGIATKATADICSYNIGINFIIDDIIHRNKTLSKLKTIYDNLNETKQEDFDTFIQIYNAEEKIKAYKGNITHKIFILNKYAKSSDKLLYNKEPNNTQNKYCIKRRELEELRSDEYIKANIDSLDVNYVNIDPSIFEIEINGTQKVVQHRVTGSVTAGKAIASASTLFTVVIGSMVIQSITFAPNAQEFEDGAIAAAQYAMKIVSDIAIIIWQFLRGVLGTPKIVSQQITLPLEERVKVLKKYYHWRLRQNKTVPSYFLDLYKEKAKDKKEDTDEIVMTPEEYQKYLETKKEG